MSIRLDIILGMEPQDLPEAQMLVCETCYIEKAARFCTCSNPHPVCEKCYPHHQDKTSSTPTHKSIPVSANRHNSEEDLSKGITELRRNLEQMDQFIREFEDFIQKCVNYLTEYRSWRLQLLRTEKAELSTSLEAAVQEVTDCLSQGTQPVSELAKALWFLPPEQLSVISYSVTIPDLRILCENCVSYQNNLQSLYQRIKDKPVRTPEEVKGNLIANNPRELPKPTFERQLFAAVKLDVIEVHDLKSHQLIKQTLPVNFGDGGSYIQVDSQTLICLGARPPSTNVYKLDMFSFEITPLSPLRTPRCYSGVANTNRFIYVFGGEEAPWKWLKSCEKYSLLGKQWLPLNSMMYPRTGFTPCTFRSLIYLPSPSTTHRIETFNPEAEIFSVISVSLPLKWHTVDLFPSWLMESYVF